MFFTDKLIQDIIENTNLYSVQKTWKSLNMNVEEIKNSLAWISLWGLEHRPQSTILE